MEPEKLATTSETLHDCATPDSGLKQHAVFGEKDLDNGEAENQKDTARVDAAIKYLYAVARGEVPFDPEEDNQMFRHSIYTHQSLIYLESLLQLSRKEIMAQALCHFIRSLTFRQITAQNDIGVAIHGLQFSIQDLALEVQAFNELMVQAIDQEACKADPGQPL